MLLRRKTIVYVVIIVLLLVFIYFIYSYREKIGRVMTPFFMAVVIAYILKPLVRKLEKRNIPCQYSILLIYLVFFGFVLGTMFFVVPELIRSTRDLIKTIPEISATYQNILNSIISTVQASDWSPDIKNVLYGEIRNGMVVLQNLAVNTLKKTLTGMVHTVTMLFDFVLAMVITYYFIKDADFFKNSVLSLMPRKWRNDLIDIGRKINSVLSNFVQGQLLTAVIVGVLEIVGLAIVGVKYPLVLGFVGGIANIIPYFGPIIGAIPAVAIALIDSPVKALWAALVFVIVQQLENAFIQPKIIEGKLGLHPVTTIFVVLIGGQFFGILGMLLAVPITAVIKVVTQSLVEAIV